MDMCGWQFGPIAWWQSISDEAQATYVQTTVAVIAAWWGYYIWRAQEQKERRAQRDVDRAAIIKITPKLNRLQNALQAGRQKCGEAGYGHTAIEDLLSYTSGRPLIDAIREIDSIPQGVSFSIRSSANNLRHVLEQLSQAIREVTADPIARPLAVFQALNTPGHLIRTYWDITDSCIRSLNEAVSGSLAEDRLIDRLKRLIC